MPTYQVFTAVPNGVSATVVPVAAEPAAKFTVTAPDGVRGLVSEVKAQRRLDSARMHVYVALGNHGCRSDVAVRLRAIASPGNDLAILCATLLATNVVSAKSLENTLVWGLVHTNGDCRPYRGTIAVARAAKAAGFHTIIVPSRAARNASLVPGISVIGVSNVRTLIAHLDGSRRLEPVPAGTFAEPVDDRLARAALLGERSNAIEIAVAGHHHVLFVANPEVKSEVFEEAARMCFPHPSVGAALDVATAWDAARKGVITERRIPVRRPLHTTVAPTFCGGALPPTPGELTLANHGLLVLDDLADHSAQNIACLRQALTTGEVTPAGLDQRSTMPARFLLLACTKPCPCGYFGYPVGDCECSEGSRARYLSRLHPVLDCIDLVLVLNPQEESEPTSANSFTTSRDRVTRARDLQARRYEGTAWRTNSEVPKETLVALVPVTDDAGALLANLPCPERVHRVARTIADLAADEGPVGRAHVLEAIDLCDGWPDRHALMERAPRCRGTEEICLDPMACIAAGGCTRIASPLRR